MPGKTETFVMVPKALLCSARVSALAKLLYAALADHGRSETAQCNPKIETLAAELGCSRRAVDTALAQLRTVGLVRIEWGQRGSTYRITSRTQLPQILLRKNCATEKNPVTQKLCNALRKNCATEPAVLITEEDLLKKTDRSKDLSLSHASNVTRKRGISSAKKRLTESETLPLFQPSLPEPESTTTAVVVAAPQPEPCGAGCTESFEVWFARFWARYPRKKAKADAMKAARRAAEKSAQVRAAILAGLDSQLPGFRSSEAKFIPYPAKWLRGEQWHDEPEAQPRIPAQRQQYESPTDRAIRVAHERVRKTGKL